MNYEYESVLGGRVFADVLEELIKEGKDIVCIENDLRFSFTDYVRQAYPDRFIDAGIAEANSIGIAAGLSANGVTPVVHSLCPFITRRCFDQIVISIQYSGLRIKVVGTDPGIYSELNGGTHLSVEDVGIMRTIPNMLIVDCVDNTALRELGRLAMLDDRSAYLRISRKKAIKVYDDDAKFELGRANTLRDGSDLTIIANGLMVPFSLDAADMLAKDGISAKVLDMHTIKPIDRDAVIAAAKMGPIVTAENSSIVNGLGSAVAEVMAEEGLGAKLTRVGIRDRYGVVGFIKDISEELEMTPADIAKAAKKVLGR